MRPLPNSTSALNYFVAVLLLLLPLNSNAAPTEELAPNIIARIEQSMKGKVIHSEPITNPNAKCYEETRIVRMGGKPLTVTSPKCRLPDGRWQTGIFYKVQLLSKKGRMQFLKVNPHTGHIQQLN